MEFFIVYGFLWFTNDFFIGFEFGDARKRISKPGIYTFQMNNLENSYYFENQLSFSAMFPCQMILLKFW